MVFFDWFISRIPNYCKNRKLFHFLIFSRKVNFDRIFLFLPENFLVNHNCQLLAEISLIRTLRLAIFQLIIDNYGSPESISK